MNAVGQFIITCLTIPGFGAEIISREKHVTMLYIALWK